MRILNIGTKATLSGFGLRNAVNQLMDSFRPVAHSMIVIEAGHQIQGIDQSAKKPLVRNSESAD